MADKDGDGEVNAEEFMKSEKLLIIYLLKFPSLPVTCSVFTEYTDKKQVEYDFYTHISEQKTQKILNLLGNSTSYCQVKIILLFGF
jgi:hypothetical protein